MRGYGCGFQGGDEQGRKFKSDVCVQRRYGHALKRGLVLRAFDNSAGVSGAFILVMGCGGIFVGATGEKLKVGGGFQKQAMRRNWQPEDCQQERQSCFNCPHVQPVFALLMPDPLVLFNIIMEWAVRDLSCFDG